MTPVSPDYQRGLVLFEQGRPADAADRFRAALAIQPQDAHAHAMLSLCLARLEQLEPATTEAQLAIQQDPSLPLAFYAMAVSMFERNRDADAFVAIDQAIALDQYNPSFFALKAYLHLRRSEWSQAVGAADQGLEIEPQHSGCLNARAQALVKLGFRAEAASTMRDALAHDPEDGDMHANQGWALLHRSQHREAMTHFRESLRLDPTNDWAKAGVVEALKASFFLYRWLLIYFLWMARLPPGAQNAIIFGGFIGYQVLKTLARNNPGVRPFVMPLLIAYSLFALLTWLAAALLNLLLRLHPTGKYALSPEQKRSSEILGGLLVLTGVFVACAIVLEPSERYGTLAITCFVSSLPATHILDCARGWPRRAMLGITLGVFAIGIYASIDLSPQPFTMLVLAAIASQFAAISLTRVRPRR